MPRIGRRTTIEPGIYRDARGYEVCVSLRRERASKRFPLNTSRSDLRIERGRLLQALEQQAGKAGTLSADIATYLRGLPKGTTTYANADYLLGHWVKALGDKPRREITAEDIRAVCAKWLAEGYAPATIVRRRAPLVSLFIAFGQRDHPLREVKPPQVREEARDIPRAAVDAILAQLPAHAKGAIHLRVMAETGLPQKMIRQIKDHDLHLEGSDPYVIVQPRRKGQGHPGKRVFLTPRAAAAFQAMRDANAYGEIHSSGLWLMFKLALRRAEAQWRKDKRGPWPVPPDARPYDLRHAYANRLLEASRGDLTAVQEALLHGNLRTTQRYTRTTMSERARAAVRALGAVLDAARPEKPRKA